MLKIYYLYHSGGYLLSSDPMGGIGVNPQLGDMAHDHNPNEFNHLTPSISYAMMTRVVVVER